MTLKIWLQENENRGRAFVREHEKEIREALDGAFSAAAIYRALESEAGDPLPIGERHFQRLVRELKQEKPGGRKKGGGAVAAGGGTSKRFSLPPESDEPY